MRLQKGRPQTPTFEQHVSESDVSGRGEWASDWTRGVPVRVTQGQGPGSASALCFAGKPVDDGPRSELRILVELDFS
jgi:hypothetical protein